jgi:hypothetical protein
MMPAGPWRSVCGILERTTISQSGYSEKFREFLHRSDTAVARPGFRRSRERSNRLSTVKCEPPAHVIDSGIAMSRDGPQGRSRRIAHGISLINHSIGRFEPKFGLYRKGHDANGAGL